MLSLQRNQSLRTSGGFEGRTWPIFGGESEGAVTTSQRRFVKDYLTSLPVNCPTSVSMTDS